MGVTLTPKVVEDDVRAIRLEAARLCDGLDRVQLNWQPEGGRRWSIGQCLDHITKGTRLYGRHIEQGIADAPRQPRPAPGRPNLLGRWFISLIEPPVKVATKAPSAIQPRSDFDLQDLLREFDAGLDDLVALASRAETIDTTRTRFHNPFLRGWRVFNVATGILLLLSHTRRHLAQAAHVKARSEFPPTRASTAT